MTATASGRRACDTTRAGGILAPMSPVENSKVSLEFAKRLSTFRTAKGVSQTNLGKLVDASQTLISCWETGLYVPDPHYIWKLEAALEVSPGMLSSALGYVPVRSNIDTMTAITTDPELDEDARQVVIHTYEAMRQQSRIMRRRSRRPSGRAAG